MNRQNGYKFYGGPLHGSFIQLEKDPGNYFEVEEYEYEQVTQFSPEVMPKHVYEKRYIPSEQAYAFYLTTNAQLAC